MIIKHLPSRCLIITILRNCLRASFGSNRKSFLGNTKADCLCTSSTLMINFKINLSITAQRGEIFAGFCKKTSRVWIKQLLFARKSAFAAGGGRAWSNLASIENAQCCIKSPSPMAAIGKRFPGESLYTHRGTRPVRATSRAPVGDQSGRLRSQYDWGLLCSTRSAANKLPGCDDVTPLEFGLSLL